jgi:beta-glucosidase
MGRPIGARACIALATFSMAVGVALPAAASADVPPYSLPVTLPTARTSPAVDANAPYTSVVLDLIKQLEPSTPPTRDQLANADKLLHDGANGACHNVGPVSAPTGTNPSIAPICWTDAQGVLNTSGPNARGSTGPMTLMGLGSTFDRSMGNAWGQTAGTEAREFMVTGIFGPQTDLDRLPNWGRNLTTTGEDPYLSNQMVSAQINGMQGSGAMSQMKHFAVYNGQSQNINTDISDQPLHENYLLPYEGGFVDGKAAATMCSYQIWRDTSTHLPTSVSSLSQPSPFQAGLVPATWPLNESHFSCEQPLILNYVLRTLFHSQAFVGSDYPATHSTSGILQGEDQEMPTQTGFFSADSANPATDPTGSTCGDPTGQLAMACSATGAIHDGGIPGPGCPVNGCKLVDSVMNGTTPLAVFNQSLARILYQEQRFGLLGCDQTPVSSLCTNPGGIGTDRTGTAPLPTGASSGSPVLGTKNGDAAIVEKYSEEGADLFKNSQNALPLDASTLNNDDVLVTGANANHLVADPTSEASTGMIDRDAVNPLQQLKEFSGKPGAFQFAPANDPTGYPVPSSALSRSSSTTTGNLMQTGPGASTSNVSSLDFTTASSAGQLAPGSYTWTGYVYVPKADTYTFAFQQSSAVANANVTFTFDGTARTLATPNQVYGATTPGTPTNAGYTEPLLTNRTFYAGALTTGYHPVTITFNNDQTSPASFRFAYSRAQGDIDDAAAAAVGKKAAIVFVNDTTYAASIPNNQWLTSVSTSPDPDHPGLNLSAPTQLSPASNALVSAVAAANPNTIVVMNTANPVLMPWFDSVKSVLEMWFAGQEGGTSTARLLLGLANPSGHSSLTWPKNATDTIWGYNEPAGALYPGSPGGRHPERLNGNGGCTVPTGGTATCPAATQTTETEGIYAGYRYFDKLGITPQVPFGYGLSYTTFQYSGISLIPNLNGTMDVSFDVKNTGTRAGADAAQVYVGPGPDKAGIQQAVRSLRGFDRVQLDPGQTKHETITLDARSFQYWDEVTQQWLTDFGPRKVWVGDSSSTADLPLSATATPIPAGSGATTTPGGTVPATLSLTLGAPATFGAFTPGITKDYTATMSANVISTAGDGTLSVSDPSSQAPGHLVNGAFSLPSALQAKATSPAGNGGAFANVSSSPLSILTYNGPVSNDPVAITFGQHIDANDALRTGSYGKTLTFTLSTTQP